MKVSIKLNWEAKKKNMGYFKALVHGVDTWAGKHTIVSVIGFCISFLFCSIMFPMVYYWLILSYTVWMVNSTMLKTHVSPYIDLFIIMLLHNKINGIKGFYCNKYSSSNFFADLYVIIRTIKLEQRLVNLSY